MSQDEKKSSTEGEETDVKTETSSSEAKKKAKYVFECVKCGECCVERSSVPVTFTDLEKWLSKGVLQSVFPYLQLDVIKIREDIPEFLQLVLKNPDGKAGCPLYDSNNKLCNIYHSLPSECNAFPLGFSGKSFILKMKTCKGLGTGKMTKERLEQDCKNAQDDFTAKTSTTSLLPLLNTLFFKHMMKQQEEMMKKMPEEQKQKLEEILKGTKD